MKYCMIYEGNIFNNVILYINTEQASPECLIEYLYFTRKMDENIFIFGMIKKLYKNLNSSV